MRECHCLLMRHFTNGNIEVAKKSRNGLTYAPLNMMFEADFCLDLITFRVLKNRSGKHNLSPEEAYKELCRCLERGERVLLLTD